MSAARIDHPCGIPDIECSNLCMGLLIQAVTEKPIPGGQSEADSIVAMDASSHSTSAKTLQAEPAAEERGKGAALKSLSSAWYAAPQQPRDIRANFRCVHLLMHLSWRSACIFQDFFWICIL